MSPPNVTVRLTAAMWSAQVLNMLGVSTVPALLPELTALWSLSGTQAGWLGGIYYAGYVLAVPMLVTLTDRIDARGIYVVGCLVLALSSLGFAVLADGLWPALAWRFLSGIGLAGTYMVGLRALADRIDSPNPSRPMAWYLGSFAVGISLSYLVTGQTAAWLDWRAAFVLAAAGSLVAIVVVLPALRRPPVRPAERRTTRLLDFRPVLRNRAAMAYAVGYGVHCWELFGVRAWVVAFLAYVVTRQQAGATVFDGTVVATIVMLVGLPASVLGNELSLRLGRRRALTIMVSTSALAACGIGFTSGLPYTVVAALAVVYGVLIMADSATLTTGMVESADPAYRGATMALHASIGFFGAFLGPIAFGVVLDTLGGVGVARAWGWAFLSLGAIVVLGPPIVWRLGRRR